MIPARKEEGLSQKKHDPFGMLLVGRNWEGGSEYRFGFNGKESDKETYGDGNIYDYGFRIYDPRIGRFLSLDPLAKNFPWYTPYQFAGNKPIAFLDLDGLEDIWYGETNIINGNGFPVLEILFNTPEFADAIAQFRSSDNKGYDIIILEGRDLFTSDAAGTYAEGQTFDFYTNEQISNETNANQHHSPQMQLHLNSIKPNVKNQIAAEGKGVIVIVLPDLALQNSLRDMYDSKESRYVEAEKIAYTLGHEIVFHAVRSAVEGKKITEDPLNYDHRNIFTDETNKRAWNSADQSPMVTVAKIAYPLSKGGKLYNGVKKSASELRAAGSDRPYERLPQPIKPIKGSLPNTSNDVQVKSN